MYTTVLIVLHYFLSTPIGFSTFHQPNFQPIVISTTMFIEKPSTSPTASSRAIKSLPRSFSRFSKSQPNPIFDPLPRSIAGISPSSSMGLDSPNVSQAQDGSNATSYWSVKENGQKEGGREQAAAHGLWMLSTSQCRLMNSTTAFSGPSSAYQASSSGANTPAMSAGVPSLMRTDTAAVQSFAPVLNTLTPALTARRALRPAARTRSVPKASPMTHNHKVPMPPMVVVTSEERKSTQDPQTENSDERGRLLLNTIDDPKAPALFDENMLADHKNETDKHLQDIFPHLRPDLPRRTQHSPDTQALVPVVKGQLAPTKEAKRHDKGRAAKGSQSLESVGVAHNCNMTMTDSSGSKAGSKTAKPILPGESAPAYTVQSTPEPTLADYRKRIGKQHHKFPIDSMSMPSSGSSSATTSKPVGSKPIIAMDIDILRTGRSCLQAGEGFSKNDDRVITTIPSIFGASQSAGPHTSTHIQSFISSPSGSIVSPSLLSGALSNSSGSAGTFHHASNIHNLSTGSGSDIKPGQHSLLVDPGSSRKPTYAKNGRGLMTSKEQAKAKQNSRSKDYDKLKQESIEILASQVAKRQITESKLMLAERINVCFNTNVGRSPASPCHPCTAARSITPPSSSLPEHCPPSASFEEGSSSSGSGQYSLAQQANGVAQQSTVPISSWNCDVEDNMSSVVMNTTDLSSLYTTSIPSLQDVGYQAMSTAESSDARRHEVKGFKPMSPAEMHLNKTAVMANCCPIDVPSQVENHNQNQGPSVNAMDAMSAFDDGPAQIITTMLPLAPNNTAKLQEKQQQNTGALAAESSLDVLKSQADPSPASFPSVDIEDGMRSVATTEGKPAVPQASAPSRSLDHPPWIKVNETTASPPATDMSSSNSEPNKLQNQRDLCTSSAIVTEGNMDANTSIQQTEGFSAAHNIVMTSEPSSALDSTLQNEENKTISLPPLNAVPPEDDPIRQSHTDQKVRADDKVQYFILDVDEYMAAEGEVNRRTEAFNVSPSWALEPYAPDDKSAVDQEEISCNKPPVDTSPYISSLPDIEISDLVFYFTMMNLQTVDDEAMDVTPDFPAIDSTQFRRTPQEPIEMDMVKEQTSESKECTSATDKLSPMDVDEIQILLPSPGVGIARSTNAGQQNAAVTRPSAIRNPVVSSLRELNAQQGAPVIIVPKTLLPLDSSTPVSLEPSEYGRGIQRTGETDPPLVLQISTVRVPSEDVTWQAALSWRQPHPLTPRPAAEYCRAEFRFQYRDQDPLACSRVSHPLKCRRKRNAKTRNVNTTAVVEAAPAPKEKVDSRPSCSDENSKAWTPPVDEDSLLMPGAYPEPISSPISNDLWSLPIWRQMYIPVHSWLKRIVWF